MSTICKLDPAVRMRRASRSAELRQLAADSVTIRGYIHRGEHVLKIQASIYRDSALTKDTVRLLRDLRVRLAVTDLTFKHIRQICKDPARTGARKDAILARLAS